MKKHKKIRLAYQFFCEVEKESRVFTLNEVASYVGWNVQTVNTYRTKRWHMFLEIREKGYLCKGVTSISEEIFIRMHSQKLETYGEVLRPRFTPEIDLLIDKSRESALLAIQIYNNPLASFRAYGYIVHMIIAYTSLFHAIFEKGGIDYWHKDKEGSPIHIDSDLRYWELDKCLDRYYSGQTTPETANLKLFIGLRNQIEHRSVPLLDSDISGLCQALLFNFEKLMSKEFGDYFALGQELAIALQLTEFSNLRKLALRKIQSKYYKDIHDYINSYRSHLPNEISGSQDFCFRAFLIPIIGNHAQSSDIAIEFVHYDPTNPDEMALYEKQVAFIRQRLVKIPVADQGKLKPSIVVQQVRLRTGVDFKINHHTNAWKLYSVRTATASPETCDIKYCQFSEPFNTVIYTQAWVDLLCDKVQDSEEFNRIKNYRPNTVTTPS